MIIRLFGAFNAGGLGKGSLWRAQLKLNSKIAGIRYLIISKNNVKTGRGKVNQKCNELLYGLLFLQTIESRFIAQSSPQVMSAYKKTQAGINKIPQIQVIPQVCNAVFC